MKKLMCNKITFMLSSGVNILKFGDHMTWLSNNVQTFTNQLDEYYKEYFKSVEMSYDKNDDMLTVNIKDIDQEATYKGTDTENVVKTPEDFENEIFGDLLILKAQQVLDKKHTDIALGGNILQNKIIIAIKGKQKEIKFDEYYSKDASTLDVGKIITTANSLIGTQSTGKSIGSSDLSDLKITIKKLHLLKTQNKDQ